MRSGSRAAGMSLHELHDLIAHLRLDGTELAFHINAVLAAQSNKIFALHAQLTRQSENTNFLFNQAELPVLTNLAYPLPLRFSPSSPQRWRSRHRWKLMDGWSVTLSSLRCPSG